MSDFQLRNFASIAAAMMNHAKATQDKVTDFEIGSVARTLIEAPAIEVEELYQKVFAGILDAIPTSIYKAFDFELVGKAAARGTVQVQFAGPIAEPFIIPAGTVFITTAGALKYTSAQAVGVALGATSVGVIVSCTVEGKAGNIGANAIVATEGYTLPIGATLANLPFTSGTDGQTEAERKARFAEFIVSLSRGTDSAVRYAVRQARITSESGVLIEYVTRIGIVEVPGLATVYVYGSSGAPSAELLATAQRIVDGYVDPITGATTPGYVALGVEVRVERMVERVIPVGLQVELLPGFAGSTSTRNAITELLDSLFESIESGSILYVDQIVNAALTVTGVRRAAASNNTNIQCGPNEVLVLGALTVKFEGEDDDA